MGKEEKSESNFTKKMKAINPWGVITGLVLLFLIGVIAYYFYLMSVKVDLKNLKQEREQVLQTKKIKYKTEINDVRYKKYQAAKVLYKDDTKIPWKKTIAYLIKKYDNIRETDNKDSNFSLEEFQLNVEGKISMVGTVNGITHVFEPRKGILDKFIKFDFLEELEVHSYERIKEKDTLTTNFTFTLNATLKPHDSD